MKPFTRRLFLVGAVLAALVMLIAPPLAGADDDDGGGGGGGGDRAFCVPLCSAAIYTFAFDVSSGPLGQNPTGTYRETALTNFIDVEITCLQVTGNTARFGGRVTDSNVVAVGSGIAVSVADNSPLADALSSHSTPVVPTAATPNCGSVSPPDLVMTDGDIVVQDNIGGGGSGDDDDDDGEDDEDEDDGDEDDDDD
jgi:hypothetical protein